MKWLSRQMKNQSGLTLVEILISMFILSIIVTSMCAMFVYSISVTNGNKQKMIAMNLANETIENIRSLQFVEVGIVDGDPNGLLPASKDENIDGVIYTINTSINWEEEGAWVDTANADWDYKSVRVTVAPKTMIGDPSVTKTIETYVTRDSTQPPLTGCNIRIRVIRGWSLVAGTDVPVSNINVKLAEGPSSVRLVQSSSSGAARFVNLLPGNYKVLVDPSFRHMMLHPEEVLGFPLTLSGNMTTTKKFHVEEPCHLRFTLKDLAGNPISLDSSIMGTMNLQVPYPAGTEIIKTFTAANIASDGKLLPQEYIPNLWPVGRGPGGIGGYPGAYKISKVTIPGSGYQYLGALTGSGASETIWDGMFDNPGTYKDIICYFEKFPVTPGSINTDGVQISGAYVNITAGNHIFQSSDPIDPHLIDGGVNSTNLSKTLTLTSGTSSSFTGNTIYFDHTGSGTNPGLLINNLASLTIRTSLVIFRGKIEIKYNRNSSRMGKIILRTVEEDGTLISTIDGGDIGQTPEISYGKIYLAEPIVSNGVIIQDKGWYYYYDGLELLKNSNELLPITKLNFK